MNSVIKLHCTVLYFIFRVEKEVSADSVEAKAAEAKAAVNSIKATPSSKGESAPPGSVFIVNYQSFRGPSCACGRA